MYAKLSGASGELLLQAIEEETKKIEEEEEEPEQPEIVVKPEPPAE